MKVSLNEMKFAIRWAALGQGTPVGLADGLSLAAIELAALGINPVGHVISALTSIDIYYTWGHFTEVENISVVEAGPVFVDSLITGEAYLFEPLRVANPILLAGYCANQKLSRPLFLSWEVGGEAVSVCVGTSGTESVHASHVDALECHEFVSVCETPAVELTALITAESIQENRTNAVLSGVEIEQTAWSGLWRLTQQALREGSEDSRLSGAGAGIADSD